jgi:hypothetical protein
VFEETNIWFEHYTYTHVSKYHMDQAPVAHTCNSSYLGDWDWENHGSKPAWANSLWDPISKISGAKCVRGMPQAVECLLCNREALNSNPSPLQKKHMVSQKCVFYTYIS